MNKQLRVATHKRKKEGKVLFKMNGDFKAGVDLYSEGWFYGCIFCQDTGFSNGATCSCCIS